MAGTVNTESPDNLDPKSVAPTEYMGYVGTHRLSQDGAESPRKQLDFPVHGKTAAWSIQDIIICLFSQTEIKDILVNIKTHTVWVRNQPVYVFRQKKQKQTTICALQRNFPQWSSGFSFSFCSLCTTVFVYKERI